VASSSALNQIIVSIPALYGFALILAVMFVQAAVFAFDEKRFASTEIIDATSGSEVRTLSDSIRTNYLVYQVT